LEREGYVESRRGSGVFVVEPSVSVEGLLVEELEEKVAQGAELPWRLVVTTFFHVQEVEALLESSGIETVALLEEATVETLKTLAGLPDDTSVGVVGNSRSCTENLLRSLRGAGLDRLQILTVYDYRDTEGIQAMLEKVQAVVCGSVPARRITELSPSKELELIVDNRTLDKGGVEMLGRMLRS
jgi:hypothetical protein